MKKPRYKIYMVDEYDGSETHYMTMFDRIEAEKIILLLMAQKWPCTSFCYYDNDGYCKRHYEIMLSKEGYII